MISRNIVLDEIFYLDRIQKSNIRLSSIDVIKNIGYWISLDNTIYQLNPFESHQEWINSHSDLVSKNIKPNTLEAPELRSLFRDAVRNGWIRVRIIGSEDLASITINHEDMIKHIPDEIKMEIMECKTIELIDIENLEIKRIPIEEIEHLFFDDKLVASINIRKR